MTWTRRRGLPTALLLLALLVAPALLLWPNGQVSEQVVAGEASPRTVIAPVAVQLVDIGATSTARREAADAVTPTLRFDDDAREQTLARVDDLFAAAAAVREPVAPRPAPQPADDADDGAARPSPPPVEPADDDQVAALEDRFGYLTDDGARALVDLTDSQLSYVRNEVTEITTELMRRQVTEAQLDAEVGRLLGIELPLRPWPAATRDALVEPLLRAVVRPTVVEDTDATDADRAAAADAVAEVTRSFAAGSPVVVAGETVDELELAALEQLGVTGGRWGSLVVRAIVGWSLATLSAWALLAATGTTVVASRRRLAAVVLSASMLAAAVAAAALASHTHIELWLAAPVAAPAALAVLLTRRGAAAAALVPAAAIAPLVIDTSATGPAVYSAAVVAAVAWLSTRVDSRRKLRRMVLAVPVIGAVAAPAALTLWGADVSASHAALVGAGGGLAAGLLVQGLLPLIEGLLGLPTITALADLTDRNHPLLRTLESDAPGTYNHSVAVGTLVEQACRAIGADPLLGQVAGLYHDIGKTRRPQFFIENSARSGVNPHDDLDPHASARVIVDHVADGVAMADEHRLPAEVVDAIRTHHGTSLVAFFWHKARTQATGPATVDPDDFRYPHATPVGKEATVLLIADGCEAATRAASQNGPLEHGQVGEIVDQIVAARLDDDQLATSRLSFEELGTVRDTLVAALEGIYHPRINYPDDD